MRPPNHPTNEKQRLSALARYKILDTSVEEVFDNFTFLASQICETPIALITLLDETRQWFKSKIGVNATETSRDISFCGHAILNDELFEIHNALEDERFHDNPLVTEDFGLRFYAGMPLTTHDGYSLGTLCVIDTVPRQLTEQQRAGLKILAKQVVAQIESRLKQVELAQLNERLSEKTAFYNSLIRSAHGAIISIDIEGKITSFNLGAEKLLGYQANEVIGKPPSIFHDPEEIKNRAVELSTNLGRTIEPGFEVFVAYAMNAIEDSRNWTYVRKDGYRLLVKLSVTLIHDNVGNLIGFLGIATDITESEQIKAALARVADLLQRTGEMAQVGGWELDLLTNEIVWSKEVFNIHEIDSLEVPQLDQAIKYYAPEAIPVISEAMALATASGKPWDIELQFITAKGKHLWVRSQGSAVLNNGKAVRLVGAFQDITERKKHQIDLEKSAIALSENARFIKTITDAMPAMVAYWNRDLVCRFANKPYLEWFGKAPELIIGTSMRTLLGETLFKLNEQYIRGALAGESQQFERTLTKADGRIGYTWCNYIPDIDDHGTVNGFYVLVTDVTPIIKAENQLKLAASVFQNTIEGIMVTDIHGAILSVNPAFTVISGYSPDEALGQTPRLLNSGRHSKEFFDDMWQTIQKSRFWHGEVWNRSKDGRVHPDLLTVTAVTDSSNQVSNYVAIFTDNTEYKMREQQRLAEEAQQRDALVREVHHRIKNNLQSVASLLSNFSAQNPELSEPLNSAITQVKSIAVVHGLQGQFVNASIKLANLIEAISNNNVLLSNSRISLDIPARWQHLLIEEKESVPLALVLNELILNALKHGDQSHAVAITLAYDAASKKVSIEIRNKGQISPTSSMITPTFGTGLQLASVLLPKKHASMSWEQSGEMVITRIELAAPMIVIEAES